MAYRLYQVSFASEFFPNRPVCHDRARTCVVGEIILAIAVLVVNRGLIFYEHRCVVRMREGLGVAELLLLAATIAYAARFSKCQGSIEKRLTRRISLLNLIIA